MRDVGEVGVGDVEIAVLVHECGVLLFVVGNAGRERRDVPVHMCVALMTAEAQHVEPFGGHRLAHGLPDAMNAALELDVLIGGERTDHVGAVFDGGDERVPEQGRPFGEEGNADVVPEHDQMIIAAPGDNGADEADRVVRVGADPLHVGLDVERDPRVSGHA